MKRIDKYGATPSKKWTEGDVVNGTPATVVSADYMNILQEELVGIVEAAGLALDQATDYPAHDTGQIKDALDALYVTKSGANQVTGSIDGLTSLGMAGPIDMNSQAITEVASIAILSDPVLSSHAARKGWVDSQVSALDARIDILETDPVTKTYTDGQVATLDGRLDALEADPATKTYVNAADAALGGRLDALELDPVTKTYVNTADTALDGRLDILEAQTRVSSIAKSGDAAITGAATLSSGHGVELTQSGSNIEIATPSDLLLNFSSVLATVSVTATDYTTPQNIASGFSIPSFVATKTTPIQIYVVGRATLTTASSASSVSAELLSTVSITENGAALTPASAAMCIPAYSTFLGGRSPASCRLEKEATASAENTVAYHHWVIPFTIMRPTVGATYAVSWKAIKLPGTAGTCAYDYVTVSAAHG